MNLTQLNFNKILQKCFLFENHPKIAVAVSGGPDSMALVYLLNNWISKRKGFLIAIIIDHQIRKESRVEAEVIKKYLDINFIQSTILKINKKKMNKKNMNQARENRYDKIINFCNRRNIFHLFVGHHYDDNVETFFLRKIAGSNFDGLAGIEMKIIRGNLQILRPLLKFTKKEIVNFNNFKNIMYVNDPTNTNINYSRAIVRKFIKNNQKYKKEIEKDFKLVRGYSLSYRKMIFEIFHKINLLTNLKSIIIDYNQFKNLDIEIKIKIVEIIYKFLLPNRSFLRYVKIIKILEDLIKNSLVRTNLAGLIIYRDKISISFRV